MPPPAAQQRQLERTTLERIARREPLQAVLTDLCLAVEGQLPEARCGVRLVDGGRLQGGAGPNLPGPFWTSTEGLPLDPRLSPCGSAATHGARAVLADLTAFPPQSEPHRRALESGLRSAWSEPVFDRHGAVVATFAVYHARPFEPDDAALAVLGHAVSLAGIAIETARDAAELERQHVFFRQLFDASPEAIVLLDAADRVVDANARFVALFQYEVAEIRGRAINSLIVPPSHYQEAYALTQSALRATVERETVRQRKDGTLVQVSVLGAPITLGGDHIGVYGIYRDLTETHEARERLSWLGSHDSLTGLLNRHAFEDRLAALLRAPRAAHEQHAVLYLDLDLFKVVNDSCGHGAGDRLLQEVAALLAGLVQSYDTLARLGGDEFGLLLRNCPLSKAEELAERLVTTVHAHRFRWETRSFVLGASAGVVALGPEDRDLARVMSAADSACAAAKERGRNRVQVFRPSDSELELRRREMDWVSVISAALEQDRFALYLQRIEPAGGPDGLPHHEVLLRMLDPEGRVIPPGQFIPPAERYNLMPALDRWVIQRVFRDAQPEDGLFSINLSGTTLSDPGFQAFVQQEFQRTGLAPTRVCFEITETAAIADLDRAQAFIAAMRRLGCTIALDDFGAGLASFGYLKSLPVDFLKIDGLFVKGLRDSPVDQAMVEAIDRIGKLMGIRTVAEFVEDPATRARLHAIGVDMVQGYGVHRPEPWALKPA